MLTLISRPKSVTFHVTSALQRQAFRRVTCVAFTLVGGFVLLASNGSTRKAESRNVVTVSAADRARPYFNFLDGRAVSVDYRGQDLAVQELGSGKAKARAIASADMDSNA